MFSVGAIMLPMATKTPTAILERVAVLFDEGKHGKQIAAELGISASVVYRTLWQSGRKPSQLVSEGQREHPRGKLTMQQKEEIVLKYVAGESASSLAGEYGVTSNIIRSLVSRSGQQVLPRGRATKKIADETIEQIFSLRIDGLSQQMIADKLGVSQSIVGRYLRKEGLSTWNFTGPRHPQWKGGRTLNGNGYVLVWISSDDPLISMATQHNYVLEHRLVMARSLGRPLTSSETVHHKNGDITDNRLENLQLRQGAHGKGVRYICNTCGSSDVTPQPLV